MKQRQGEEDAVLTTDFVEQPGSRPERPAKSELSLPGRVAEFFREVRSELRQVAWPTRPEVMNSATVVFITLVVLVCLIFVLNYSFAHSISWLYKT